MVVLKDKASGVYVIFRMRSDPAFHNLSYQQIARKKLGWQNALVE